MHFCVRTTTGYRKDKIVMNYLLFVLRFNTDYFSRILWLLCHSRKQTVEGFRDRGSKLTNRRPTRRAVLNSCKIDYQIAITIYKTVGSDNNKCCNKLYVIYILKKIIILTIPRIHDT